MEVSKRKARNRRPTIPEDTVAASRSNPDRSFDAAHELVLRGDSKDPSCGAIRITRAQNRRVKTAEELAALREQRRLGLDLHDRLGPLLIGTSMLARRLHGRLAAANLAEAESAAMIVEHLKQCYEQVRGLAKSLTESHPDLADALSALAARTQTVHDVEARYSGPSRAVGFSGEAVELYRIAQEAVSNAIRHALPRQILISLIENPECLELAVQDDGIGICPALPATGVGMWSMRYRAESIGGRLEIARRPEGGTLVRCQVPLSCEEDITQCRR